MTICVILAAGQGTRLRPYTNDRPKCFVELKKFIPIKIKRKLLKFKINPLKLFKFLIFLIFKNEKML